MQITGNIKHIFEAQTISERFRKREFVIEYVENPMYPQLILFQAVQDRCELLDDYKEGQTVEVSFNLRGREWTSPSGEVKYFNTLEAWRINPAQDQATPEPVPVAEVVEDEKKSSDLPF